MAAAILPSSFSFFLLSLAGHSEAERSEARNLPQVSRSTIQRVIMDWTKRVLTDWSDDPGHLR